MDDADYWPPDYETWHHFAKDAMTRLATEGVIMVRQPIDPERFADWCREHDRPADSDARLTFAANDEEIEMKSHEVGYLVGSLQR